MLNVQSIFLQIVKAIEEQPKMKEALDFNQFKIVLVKKIEHIIKGILINLGDYYPQAPITGGTPRMNNAIN